MDTHRFCPECKKPLAPLARQGLCPECLIKAGLGSEVDMGPDSRGGSGPMPFAAPDAEEVGRLFPQLEVLGFIGQGGMGAVYKARQRELDRVVALKILTPGIGQDPAFTERFTREAKALAKLNHPGIVTLYEFGKADGLYYFLMEFVDGVSLRHLLGVERVSAREALAIVPQICDALQYAHDQGIVHRDIKPENILLDRQGRVKVADFGLAKLIGPVAEAVASGKAMAGSASLTDGGKVMGTPQYMAPEQREHPTEVDHRADIYSLGVVFYQMLTGELPGQRLEPPSSRVRGMQVDVRLDEVVLRALEREPERRYQQISQVKTAVETIALARGGGSMPAVQAETPGSPRLSRAAIWGTVWALVWAVDWVWSYTPPGWKVTEALRNTIGHWATGFLMGPLALVAFAAPLGVTVTGWLAVRAIRRSQGRLRGMALALADAIFFPLLLLAFWLAWLCSRIGAQLSGATLPHSRSGLIIGVLLALALAAGLSAWLWSRVREPLSKPRPAPGVPAEAAGAGASPGKALGPAIWRWALISLVQTCLLETILQAAVHRPESVGELWYLALFSGSLGAMVWAAWPLRRWRSHLLVPTVGALIFFAAMIGLDTFYSLHLRPNVGLYEEDDWVSQHPGFQWGWRQAMARNLWRKPVAAPFAPAREMVLALDEQHPVALLDLDTGQPAIPARFDPDDEGTRSWLRAGKLDLALVLKNGQVTALGLGLGVGWVPNLIPRAELTSQAAVNFWLLDRRRPKEAEDLRLGTNMAGTFVFRTREGGIGFCEFGGLSDTPRGVKVRYKLVPATLEPASQTPNTTSGQAAGNQAQVVSTDDQRRFGSVIERVVRSSSPDCELDLDTGKLGQIPSDLIRTTTGTNLYALVKDWRTRNGFDAAGFSERNLPADSAALQARSTSLARAGFTNAEALYSGFNVFDMWVSRLANEQWTQMTPTLAWSLAASNSPVEWDTLGAPNTGGPTTWLFRTREGGIGILQIVGPADGPRPGVNIRYKLAQER